MKPIDYILIGIVALVTIGVSIHLIKRKKAGKGGCGCGCQNCPSAGACGARSPVDKKESEDEETV